MLVLLILLLMTLPLLLLMLGMEKHVNCSSELPPSSLCFNLITLLPSPVESVVTMILQIFSLLVLSVCPLAPSDLIQLPGDRPPVLDIDSPMFHHLLRVGTSTTVAPRLEPVSVEGNLTVVWL